VGGLPTFRFWSDNSQKLTFKRLGGHDSFAPIFGHPVRKNGCPKAAIRKDPKF